MPIDDLTALGNQMKMLYSSCPSEMRDTFLHHTQETVKELTELSEKFETN